MPSPTPMSDTLDRIGVTLESEHPRGSIGYEWDAVDHWARFIGGEKGKALGQTVTQGREQFRAIQRQAIVDFVDLPDSTRARLLALMERPVRAAADGTEGGAKA